MVKCNLASRKIHRSCDSGSFSQKELLEHTCEYSIMNVEQRASPIAGSYLQSLTFYQITLQVLSEKSGVLEIIFPANMKPIYS